MRPLLLDPVLVPKPWGGRRLADLGADLPDEGTWGEAWVVADLDPAATVQPDPASRVRGGPDDGRALADLLGDDRHAGLLGPVADHDGRFPLLVKLLDAREHLSVQVHPPAGLVDLHPGARLKTESWVVVAAEPDAVLFLGLVDDATPDRVRTALGTRDLVPLLRRVPARPGDVVHVPAGMVHALGAGVVVAEVQTPSDTTWRLYDWVDEYAREPRELHTEPGWAAIEATWEANTTPPRPTSSQGRLVTTDHYTIDRLVVDGDATIDPDRGRPVVLMVLAGGVSVAVEGADEVVGPGEVVVLPADRDGPAPMAVDATDVLATSPV